MNWPRRERWRAVWQATNAAVSPDEYYEQLMEAYAHPQRHYHNQRHIAECLVEFDQARHLARQPAAVELALWFHDAVYNPRASDNEEQSAALAEGCMVEAGTSRSLAESVARLVMATKHHGIGGDLDTGLVVDVDLSILGRDEKRFSEYEQQIRQEYEWVPEAMFAAKRAEILQGFLARERIFRTGWFHDKYERQARVNLEISINKLWTLAYDSSP